MIIKPKFLNIYFELGYQKPLNHTWLIFWGYGIMNIYFQNCVCRVLSRMQYRREIIEYVQANIFCVAVSEKNMN